MISISKISKSLIIVSLVFSIMVCWLGSRYFSDALTHYSSASNLQRSVIPETTLFEIAKSLNNQRNAVQTTLITANEFGRERALLSDLAQKTKTLLSQSRFEITQSTLETTDRLHHRFGMEPVDQLLDELQDKFKRMSITSSIILRQVYLPHAQRDESIRMRLFDAYTGMIKSVNDIRMLTHGLPDRDYIDVLAAHDIKNVIWDLSESVNQTSILVEAYLQKNQYAAQGTINRGNLDLRVHQQHERASQALLNLAKMVRNKEIAGVSNEAVSELKSNYHDTFHLQVRNILLTQPGELDPSRELTRWTQVSAQTKEKVQLLIDAALSNTIATADSTQSRAVFSLLASALIVVFCLGMAYVTFKIARRVQHQADYDELTDLPNRRYFHDALESLIKNTQVARGEKLVLMTLDLNGFKAINDTMGHIAGDGLLRQVAHRLKSIEGDNRITARMGGDEFAIAYTFSANDDPYQFASLIRDTFAPAFIVDESLAEIDTSIGFSIYPDDAKSLNELQITSDFAMYSAKASGRKAIKPFDREVADHLENRIAIEKDLPIAVENDQLELYYQPQINLLDNEVYSVEALVRWNHPQRGKIPPDEFISVAEETGLMPAIGSWVLNEACAQAAIWNNKEDLKIRVAVNVSVHQMTQADFVQGVLDAISRHNIPTGCLELEITESVVMADIEYIAKSLDTLKQHGVRIALDDFGTGYSSLNQLQSLPLDTLKIDRSFISRLDDESISMKSVTATIASIAEIYKLETVAEGIETEQQLLEVRKLGIDVAQGYYYSKPVNKDEVAEAIASIDQLALRSLRKVA